MITSTDLADRVHRARVAAVETMSALAGSSSACAIARDGGSFPAYKFHEGRMAAFTAAARGLRRGQDVAALVAGLESDWSAEVRRRADQSRDWQAYAAGGQDAVRELEAWLAGVSSPG